MFVNDTTTFDGKWFQVKDAYNVPKPVQAGGPPVLIDGSGEKKTLRMVAQYGDACNVFGDATQIRHLLDVLDEHCERLGRNPKEICRTRLGTLVLGRTMEKAQEKLRRDWVARTSPTSKVWTPGHWRAPCCRASSLAEHAVTAHFTTIGQG